MVSRRTYFTIVMIITIVFLLFMFGGVWSYIDSEQFINEKATKVNHIKRQDTITPENLNLDDKNLWSNVRENKSSVAIISSNPDDAITKLLEEWCIYLKYFYKIYTYLPELDEVSNYDIIIFGDIDLKVEDYKILYSYSHIGNVMIFTKLPDFYEIDSNKKFADFFGIEAAINKEVVADGIRIFPDFMIGGERIYQEGDYFGSRDDTSIKLPYYKLRAGYDIYSVGLFDNQDELGIENIDLPPLLWRTKTEDSFIFVINSDIFREMSLLGVLTEFMVKTRQCYVYPVVNAQTISLVNYPYFSSENEAVIRKIYSRSSNELARDILWPNIIQIINNYSSTYNFFVASQLDYQDGLEGQKENLDFYIRELSKLPNVMGLSLGQVSNANIDVLISNNEMFFNEYLPNYKFTSLFTGDFTKEEIKIGLEGGFLDNINLLISNYKKGDRLLDFIEDDLLSVRFNLNGYEHESLDDLQMKSIHNALGMCNMKVDFSRVIFPEDESDEWNNLSLIWSRGDTYFKDYSYFDMVTIYELENRVRRFLALDYIYEYNNEEVSIRIDNFDQEAYFILSVYDKSIVEINKGEAKKISEDKYLIKATGSHVEIKLKEDYFLQVPR